MQPVVHDEFEIAEEILNAIPTEAELQSKDRRTLRYCIRRRHGWKLSSIVFSRESLRKLAADANRDVKIEYLQREIASVLERRATYVYPRALTRGRGASEAPRSEASPHQERSSADRP
jgi:hypothetical protein